MANWVKRYFVFIPGGFIDSFIITAINPNLGLKDLDWWVLCVVGALFWVVLANLLFPDE
jgi:hypothetical protein